MKGKQIRRFLKASKQELRKYYKTKNITHLQQAGNKIYQINILLIESIKKEEIKTHKRFRESAKELRKDKDIFELNGLSNYLHSFFYEGVGDEYWIIKNLKMSYYLIYKIIKRYKL